MLGCNAQDLNANRSPVAQALHAGYIVDEVG